jgi:multisubunit Na+/H+ antiporter MnhF subunit
MNIWTAAAAALGLGLALCGWVIARARTIERLAALQMAGTLTTLILLLIARGVSQSSFCDLALASALLSFPAGLLFAHFFERWL